MSMFSLYKTKVENNGFMCVCVVWGFVLFFVIVSLLPNEIVSYFETGRIGNCNILLWEGGWREGFDTIIQT